MSLLFDEVLNGCFLLLDNFWADRFLIDDTAIFYISHSL